VLQAVVNMGVAVDLFPVTGQPLPFISRGGTSIIFSSPYIGIILSVSRYAEKVSETSEEPAEEAFKNETDEYYNQANMA
jgi:cell division protein FtsW